MCKAKVKMSNCKYNLQPYGVHQLSSVIEVGVEVEGWTRLGLGEHVDAEMGGAR